MIRWTIPTVLLLALVACGKAEENPAPPQADMPATQSAAAPTSASTTLPPAAVDALRRYESQTQAFLKALDAGADAQALSPLAQELMALSLTIQPAYVAVRPECREYLAAAARIAELWPTLTLESIEQDFHRDGALPKSEATPACYHMKDLIVHPATALALLAQPALDRKKLREEIDELSAHAGAVRAMP